MIHTAWTEEEAVIFLLPKYRTDNRIAKAREAWRAGYRAALHTKVDLTKSGWHLGDEAMESRFRDYGNIEGVNDVRPCWFLGYEAARMERMDIETFPQEV